MVEGYEVWLKMPLKSMLFLPDLQINDYKKTFMSPYMIFVTTRDLINEHCICHRESKQK